MIGPHARRVGVRVSSAIGLHLKVWAVRSGTLTSVLVINKGPYAANVWLCCMAPASSARVERLSASSINSSEGVTLAGRVIGRDGRWHGHATMLRLAPHRGSYVLAVPGYSAALVRVAER